MKWEILHIPERPPSSLKQSTVDVLASTIVPKLANILVRELIKISPLEDLRHVKRVRRRSVEGKIELSVILCLSNGQDNYMEGLMEDLLQLINAYQLNPFKAKVAKYAALSKEDWEEQCKLWPTSYHPQNNIDGIVGFSDEESMVIFNYMKATIQLTRSNCLVAKVVNAAVIVDPLSRQIIASAIDDVSNIKPDCLKFSANGRDSALNRSPDECRQSYTEVSCLNPWRWRTHDLHNEKSVEKCTSNRSWHPLRHAALVAIEKAAARDRKLFPGSGSSEDWSHLNEGLQDWSDSSPAKRQKTHNPENEDILVKSEHVNCPPSASTRPYLCTGFDIYLVWEPCTMCAMGLVHQRIRRIFYAFPNPNAGALGSVYRLQGERSLNHHYSVFRVLLPEKALHEVESSDLDGSS